MTHQHLLSHCKAHCTPCLQHHVMPTLPTRPPTRIRRKTLHICNAAGPSEIISTWLPLVNPDGALALVEHLRGMLTLAYEPIVLPCSSMNCGDMIYRSTLDPVLRMEQRIGLTPQGVAILILIATYLSATPGVAAGFVDYYISGPLQRLSERAAYGKDDIKVGRKLATGGFGTVYRGELLDTGEQVIVKNAKEFGEAEVWMNERMMRIAPNAVAQFINAFEDDTPPGKGAVTDAGNPLWLVWKYEGDNNLFDLMSKKEFPYNMEDVLFGRELRLPKGPQRRALTLQVIMKQLLEALAAAHSTGIVHRDIKPQNCIVSLEDQRIKLIDWGAAADLRIGINYVPNEYLLDPRYAPPQQYIMSTQTPRAPPLPIAAGLSPILWRLNSPDRFDMWSAGVVMLQLVFAPLRTDNTIIAFNKKLAADFNYDLRAWRRSLESGKAPLRKEYAEGFEVLDANGGAGWDLLCSLMQFQPEARLSAAKALQHPWLDDKSPTALAVIKSVAAQVGSAADKMIVDGMSRDWIVDGMARSGTEKVGGFTEAQLSEELGFAKQAAAKPVYTSNTIAWWKNRQAEVSAKIARKQAQKPLRDLSASIARQRRKKSRQTPTPKNVDSETPSAGVNGGSPNGRPVNNNGKQLANKLSELANNFISANRR